MHTGAILKTSLIAGFVVGMTGAAMRIMHYAAAEIWLWAGLLLWALFMITAIAEVSRSRRIPGHEKVMWIVGFICAGLVTGVIYLAIGRKRVTFAA